MINNWLNKLERKYRRFGIENLIGYIIGLNALVFVLNMVDPTGTIIGHLNLVPSQVLDGEFWRVVTFLFIPPRTSPLFVFIALYLYYIIGKSLEEEWGSFKFTLYYLLGAIGTVAASFISGGIATSQYLNLSLFLAFATIYPNFTLRLFFVFRKRQIAPTLI
ncbi:rhomboid family intramembrane serine protease [Natranaerobius trueperi]|uniref:Peptidase S54 rhomboid domain-containing protein n=1 Tax=Natranaerobius trueperi TaxID=759412 RepID=A0A226BWR0_9FIRM|nr:rhomboid family intramembrane serine protease [Natranaerobius trueperi]OWZ82744.1 hypothetical protein CDO51_12380 [Natranaerobius trueperi]